MQATLITIGNTHVRYCTHDGNHLGKMVKIKTNILKKPSCFGLAEDIKTIYGVSVVPSATALLKKFADKHGIALQMFASPDYPFANLTDEPSKVGADRLLAVMGAKQLGYQPPLVVIDMGTATTVNFVNQAWGFEGGLIMPSRWVMTESLHQSTAQLPNVSVATATKLSGNKFIGKNTNDAMAKGATMLADSALEKILQTAQAENRKVVFTGGHATMTLPHVESHVEPDLLFHGLVYFLAAR